MVVLVFLALFLSFTNLSSGATYCLCKDGVADSMLQKTIDYACGNGADCRPILQNGACFQPNTIKAHCDYAANSYFQNKAPAGTCDFSGTAIPSTTLPSTVISGCSYPTSPGQITTATGGTTTGGTSTGVPGSNGSGPTSQAPTGGVYNGSPSLQQHFFLSLILPFFLSLFLF